MDVIKKKPVIPQQPRPKRSSVLKKALITGVVVLLIGAVCVTIWISQIKNPGALDKNAYQAVFLSNGQVYFGKIQNVNVEQVELSDIYYLQTQQSDGKSGNDATKKLEDNNNEIKLIKLGNELHGPQDKMVITKPQVLFWENLKSDSRVSKAIDDYTSKSNDK